MDPAPSGNAPFEFQNKRRNPVRFRRGMLHFLRSRALMIVR